MSKVSCVQYLVCAGILYLSDGLFMWLWGTPPVTAHGMIARGVIVLGLAGAWHVLQLFRRPVQRVWWWITEPWRME